MNQDIKTRNWNIVSIPLMIVAILLILFSFIAPYVFTGDQVNSRFNFTNTGAIGDTIGGLMNPFIALAGVFMTFIAFYMQIKANELQIELFNKGLQSEKLNALREEKLDSYYKMSLLKHDLEFIEKDIINKADRIKEYFEKERSNSFETNILFRTLSKHYVRTLDIDRLTIYKGFKFFLSLDDSWLKKYSNLYSILDLLPDFFEKIYDIFERHSVNTYNLKMEIATDLNELMKMNAKIIKDYRSEKGSITYLKFPTSKLCNESILKYYEIIKEGSDEDRSRINETDLEKINKNVLLPFLTETLKLRDDVHNFDKKLEPVMELTSDIRKKLQYIKNRMLEVSENIEIEYNKLMIDEQSKNSYFTELKNIQNFIESGLLKTNLDDL